MKTIILILFFITFCIVIWAPKRKRKIDPNTYQRIRKINDELLSQGMTWPEIEAFWKDCINTAKNKNNPV
jgi:preprotein translocase subunit YajC